MSKNLLLIGVSLFVAAAIGAVSIVSMQPNEYVVLRSIEINAPADVVFAQLNDLRAWDAWSPWKELDPNPQTAISNPSEGQGATFSWNGNDLIGQGTLTIVESKPDELVDVEQVFVRPHPGKAHVTFTLTPGVDGTQLVWKLHGERTFSERAVLMFVDVDMDKTVGKSFEQCLLNIRDIAEGNGGVPIQTIVETPSDQVVR